MDHPAVAQVVTFAMPARELGEEVAAAVVLREGGRRPSDELRDVRRERLADFKVPRKIVIARRDPEGRDRQAAAHRAGRPARAPADGPSTSAPRGHVEERLAAFWREVLGLDRVGIDDNFFQAGGDSIRATQVVARIRVEFEVETPWRSCSSRRRSGNSPGRSKASAGPDRRGRSRRSPAWRGPDPIRGMST